MRDIDESLNCSISLIARFQICLTQNCGQVIVLAIDFIL